MNLVIFRFSKLPSIDIYWDTKMTFTHGEEIDVWFTWLNLVLKMFNLFLTQIDKSTVSYGFGSAVRFDLFGFMALE